jgi:hypothetical protein
VPVVAALAVVAAGGVAILASDSWPVRAAILVLLVVVLGVTAGVVWTRPAGHVLHAVCDGRAQALFESDDLLFFNQVCRALSRARLQSAAYRGSTTEPAGPAFLSRSVVAGTDGLARSLLAGFGVLVMLVSARRGRRARARDDAARCPVRSGPVRPGAVRPGPVRPSGRS